MKKQIAILASGGKERTEEIIKRFNAGERVAIAMVLTDRENSDVRELEGKYDTEILFFDRPDWHESEKIAQLLHDRRVELIVTDDFRPVIPEGIEEAYAHRILDLGDCTATEAPGVIMKHLMQEKSNPDKAWAEALGIKYEPAAVPPPAVSETEVVETMTPPPYSGAVPPPPVHSATAPREVQPAMPPTYLVWSIVCTLLCCFIPGLLAIFFSSQVSSKYYAGDQEGAEKASRRAEIWIIVSFVLGVISATLYFPLMLIRSAF